MNMLLLIILEFNFYYNYAGGLVLKQTYFLYFFELEKIYIKLERLNYIFF